MKLKNVLMILLTLGLVLSMAGSVVAADTKTITNENQVSESTAVIFSHASQTYTVTIPAEINLAQYNSAVEAEVTATNVVLDERKELVVKAKSTYGWNLTKMENSIPDPNIKFKYKFEYILNNDGTTYREPSVITDEFIILSVKTGEGTGMTPMKFTRIEMPPETGSYADYIEFSATIQAQAP